MARLLLRRKLSIKSDIKPISTTTSISNKEPKTDSTVEFRWSTSINQLGLRDNDSLLNFHFIDLDHSHQKNFFLSPSSTARNSSASTSPLLIDKFSPSLPRLPNTNNLNKKKNVSISADENNNEHSPPLLLTYSQLYHAKMPSQSKKKPESQYSLLPLLNNGKRNNISNSLTSTNQQQQQINNNKYIRLQPSQLRRLHVSTKYMKEAKKLYFNAASKVFVPRRSIIEMS